MMLKTKINCSWHHIKTPWNGTGFWLDPAGAGFEVRQHAKKIIHEGLLKFSLLHRTDIKNLKKNPEVKWRYPQCPHQALGTNDCGYHICRYMLEIIESRQQVILDQYIRGIKQTYSQANIDQIRDLWITYFNEQRLQNLDMEIEGACINI